MDQNIIIRKANLKDKELLLHFEQGVLQAELPYDVTLKKEGVVYYDIDELITAPHIELLVAEKSNEIIGSGYARIEKAKAHLQHENYAYFGFMYVAPECRGQGINRMIINGLKEWCNKQKVTELRLDVYSGNLGAIRAYEKVGFSNHMIEMRMKLDED